MACQEAHFAFSKLDGGRWKDGCEWHGREGFLHGRLPPGKTTVLFFGQGIGMYGALFTAGSTAHEVDTRVVSGGVVETQ